MKYIFIDLKVVNGEYEYSCKSVHVTKAANISFVAEKHAGTFYGGRVSRSDTSWYFYGGEVAVQVANVKEISEQQYQTLKQFI
jgi:hypothetical protein